MLTLNEKDLIADQLQVPKLIGLKKEDTIDLRRFPISLQIASNEINDCINYLKINNVPVQGNKPIEIIKNVAAFPDLYLKAQAEYPNPGEHVMGLKIRYGIDKGNICLIYQLILLQKTKTMAARIRLYTYATTEGSFYVYDNATEAFVDAPADYQTYIDNYKDEIRILHNDETTHEAFVQDVDAECAIFSFQEIFNMIYDNLPEQTVLIFNCVKKDPSNPVFEIRHGIIFSPNIYPIPASNLMRELASFYQMYGNLAHLCPPNCKVMYQLEP